MRSVRRIARSSSFRIRRSAPAGDAMFGFVIGARVTVGVADGGRRRAHRARGTRRTVASARTRRKVFTRVTSTSISSTRFNGVSIPKKYVNSDWFRDEQGGKSRTEPIETFRRGTELRRYPTQRGLSRRAILLKTNWRFAEGERIMKGRSRKGRFVHRSD